MSRIRAADQRRPRGHGRNVRRRGLRLAPVFQKGVSPNQQQATSDLAYEAATGGAEMRGAKRFSALGLIVVGTSTPDHVFPSVACKLQDRLGCRPIAAFDVNAACAGFLTCPEVSPSSSSAQALPNTSLVVGADTMSRIIDYQDRGTCILFGDGAGAFVLSRQRDAGAFSQPLVQRRGALRQALRLRRRLTRGD